MKRGNWVFVSLIIVVLGVAKADSSLNAKCRDLLTCSIRKNCVQLNFLIKSFQGANISARLYNDLDKVGDLRTHVPKIMKYQSLFCFSHTDFKSNMTASISYVLIIFSNMFEKKQVISRLFSHTSFDQNKMDVGVLVVTVFSKIR